MSCFLVHPKYAFKASKGWRLSHHQNIISLLQNFSKMEELKQIHAQMTRTCLMEDTFLASRIIAFLTLPSAHFNMDYAHHVFDKIHRPNLFIWNSMIRGYIQNHSPEEALFLYKQMLHRGSLPDNYTYPIVTKACAHLHVLATGKTIHGLIIKRGFESDMHIMSGFISLYASCGKLDVARGIFEEMPQRDVVSWTSMISGYVQSKYCEEAFLLFEEMKIAGVEPNKITIMSLLLACGQLQDLERGHWLHSHIIENEMECDELIGNSLVNMYAKCGSMPSAVEVFKNLPKREIVSWNALIGGLVKSGLYADALTLFQEMKDSDAKPNEITVVSALSACAQLGDLKQGELIHAYIVEQGITCDIFMRNALVNMYAKCGNLQRAAHVFHEMPEKDVFSWTAMISGYVQGNCFKEALTLYEEMKFSNVEPNEVTLVSLLSACAQLGALDQGRQIHAYIEEINVNDVCLGNALIDMYAKCGCIETAKQMFCSMPLKDTFSWTTMIGGLASHGHGREAINLFNQMQRIGDAKPDTATFIAVLCACTHSGMIHEGYHYLCSMSSMYGITPGIEHYGCIVDLLCRAGRLDEAINFILRMPIEPNAVIWGSLLAACRVHHNLELGEKVAQHIIKSAPSDEGAHVLISNIYAEAGRWDDVSRARALMGSNGIEKSPGCSSIEVNGVIHDFCRREIMPS